MTTGHTATPWHLVDNEMYFEIVVPWRHSSGTVDQYCPKICTVSYEDNDGIVGKPNAELIVQAVNSHDALVASLTQAIEAAGFALSGPTDIRAAEHGEPAWVCNARAALATAGAA